MQSKIQFVEQVEMEENFRKGPIPVIETRRALGNASQGAIIKIIGTQQPSKLSAVE